MERRTCPSCNLNFTSERQSDCYLGTASELEHCWVLSDICPGCNHLVVWVGALENSVVQQKLAWDKDFDFDTVPEDIRMTAVFPRIPPRGPAPPEVPAEFGDFIYCDPPYDGTFTRCNARGFGEPEQRRLRDTVLKWQGLGAQAMVSNADTPFIRSIYSESSFSVHQVSAPRSINSKGNGRGPVNELLITAYTCSQRKPQV